MFDRCLFCVWLDLRMFLVIDVCVLVLLNCLLLLWCFVLFGVSTSSGLLLCCVLCVCFCFTAFFGFVMCVFVFVLLFPCLFVCFVCVVVVF